MPIPDSILDLAGRNVLITSSPHALAPFSRPPIFADHLRIGESFMVISERDRNGNVRVIDPTDRPTQGQFTVSPACLTITSERPRDVPPSEIQREEAAHVLSVYTGAGYSPGSFVRSLIETLQKADTGNRALLALGFPGYAAAVNLAANHADGIPILQAINRGERKVLAVLTGQV